VGERKETEAAVGKRKEAAVGERKEAELLSKGKEAAVWDKGTRTQGGLARTRKLCEAISPHASCEAPARRRTLTPSTLLRGTPRAAALRSFYI